MSSTKSELERLRQIVMDHETRISRVETKIDSINDKMDFIIEMIQRMDGKIDDLYRKSGNSNNKKIDSLMRWNIILWITVLSFIAAVLGVNWHP